MWAIIRNIIPHPNIRSYELPQRAWLFILLLWVELRLFLQGTVFENLQRPLTGEEQFVGLIATLPLFYHHLVSLIQRVRVQRC